MCQSPAGELDHAGNGLAGCHRETSEAPDSWEAGWWSQGGHKEEAAVTRHQKVGLFLKHVLCANTGALVGGERKRKAHQMGQQVWRHISIQNRSRLVWEERALGMGQSSAFG